MYSGEKLTDLEVDDILKHIDLAEDLEGNVKYEGTLELQEPCRSRKRFHVYLSLSDYFIPLRFTWLVFISVS